MTWLDYGLVSTLTVMLSIVMIRAWRGEPEQIFSPLVFFSAMMLYYAVAGPMMNILRGDVEQFGLDMQPLLWKGWLASILAYAGFLLGYYRKAKRDLLMQSRADDTAVLMVSIVFFALAGYAMAFWVIKYGGGWQFLRPTYTVESAELSVEGFESAFATYTLQLVNLTFGAAALLLLYVLDHRSRIALILFCIVLAFSVLFFVKTGFRYRLAWMLVGLAATYYLWRNCRPSVFLWVPAVALFLAAMGFIGSTRNYYGGLSMERVEGKGLWDFFYQGFSDSAVFFTLSQVVDAVPRDMPHTYWDPLWVAVTYPIPRSVWRNKPVSQTIRTMAYAYGQNDAIDSGVAVPYYGEWYIAFGWPGIFLSSLAAGWLARRLWDWYRGFRRDKMALVVYSVGLGFMYIAFSRGMLASALMNFSFSVLPLFLLHRLMPKIKFLTKGFQFGHPATDPSEGRPGEMLPTPRFRRR